MNTRYAFPVAVAVAVHATLAFGFRRAEPIVRTNPPVEKSEPFIEIIPPEDPPVAVSGGETAEQGSPHVAPPQQPDEPRVPRPDDITIDLRPPVPGVKDTNTRIFDWPGKPGRPGPEKIVTESLLDNPPNARVRLSPDYPAEARRAGVVGEVMVEFEVDETGRVLNPVIVSSSDRVFEVATLRAVLKWRFEPGKRGGQVVRFRMASPVVFRLDN